MRQKQGVFSLFLLSPSSRRAWIEMETIHDYRNAEWSPSSRRAWIEMFTLRSINHIFYVALLAEGVDRNILHYRMEPCRARGRPPRGGRG